MSVKRSEAIARNNEWTKLATQQQLDYLDKHNLVAKKQRANLNK